MPDKISSRLAALSRRDFLKLMVSTMTSVAFVSARRVLGVPGAGTNTGYGSGGYGTGKYGVSSDRYSLFLPTIRK